MRALTAYIERKNSWAKIFKGAQITFPLTQKNVDDLIDSLNGDLSPENLHCDGEISASEARTKYQFLKTVADDLADYTWKNSLTMREVYEL